MPVSNVAFPDRTDCRNLQWFCLVICKNFVTSYFSNNLRVLVLGAMSVPDIGDHGPPNCTVVGCSL